ncbi:hypothetical protein V6M85_02870 [Sulfolobus tengchongensis]|uniref:Uncharacterized protein n=1 Tax=Sulfolobus tengchongensis TaxID=207809 RepID=A0AAX4L2G3_9CREN
MCYFLKSPMIKELFQIFSQTPIGIISSDGKVILEAKPNPFKNDDAKREFLSRLYSFDKYFVY